MFNNQMAVEGMAHLLIAMGLTPVSLKEKSKIPKKKNWNTEPPDIKDFKTGNIGIMGLVDVDLDCPEAVRVSRYFLPKTGMIFGRESVGPAHWMYDIKDQDGYKKFEFQGACIAEYRPLFGKRCTMIPTSTHPSGEKVRWIKGDDAAASSKEIVLPAVAKIAACVVLGRSWAEGSRQDATLALAGGLATAGWDDGGIRRFISCVLELAEDKDPSRDQAVEATLEKYAKQEKVTGFTTLKEILGADVVSAVMGWLKITKVTQTNGEISMSSGNTFITKSTQKGAPVTELLCSFEVAPVRVVRTSEGELWRLRLRSSHGVCELDFPADSWVSAQKLKQLLASQGTGYLSFFGSDLQVQKLKAYIYTLMDGVPHVDGVTSVGMHVKDGAKLFVTTEGALGVGGPREDLAATVKYSVKTKLLSATPMKDFKALKKVLSSFNDPIISNSVMGWVAACFYKPLLHTFHEVSGFPILALEGVAGSGKTQTAEIVARIFGLDTTFPGVASVTPFIFAMAPGASNCLPLIYEEYKPSRMQKHQQHQVSTLVRDAYTQVATQKGTRSLDHVDFPKTAPILICGESGFDSEPAHLERVIQCSFGRDQSFKRAVAFKELRAMDLAGLGRALLEKALRTSEDRVQEVFLKELADVTPYLETRVRSNAAVLRMGLSFLEELTGAEMDRDQIDLGLMHYTQQDETGRKQKTAVGMILETFAKMAETTGTGGVRAYGELGLEEGRHFKVVDGELRLHLAAAYPLFKAWAVKYLYNGDMLEETTFRRQLSKEPYALEGMVTTRMKASTVKCFRASMAKMRAEGLEVETFDQEAVEHPF